MSTDTAVKDDRRAGSDERSHGHEPSQAAKAAPTPRIARVFDLCVIVLALPVLLFLSGLIALAIALDSPGPVLYRSERVGTHGRRFNMLKFRKMRRDERGLPLTLHSDHRFTPIGRFLMLTRLDELPQVLNVLRGEMRLVGPRPELPEFVAAHPAPYDEILTVTPGITGVAQLHCASEGVLLAECEDPVLLYTSELLPNKISLDVGYVRRRSLLGDLRIVAATSLLPVQRIWQAARRTRGRRLAYLLGGTVLTVVLLSCFAWASSIVW